MQKINENKYIGSFLERSVKSFTALDIVFHYTRQPKAQETPKTISQLLGKCQDEITCCLEQLVERKILQRIKKKGENWYLPSPDVKKSEILKLLKQCLDDKDKRIKLLSMALTAIREQKPVKRRKNNMKKLASLLFGATALASTALAAPDTCKIFLWDNDAGETAQEAPAAVMDRNTNSCYVWADQRAGDWNIYGRLWGRKPETLSDAYLVNKSAKDGRDQKAPAVAGKTGEFVFAVWQDSTYGDPYWQIYGRKMAPDGKPLSDEFRVNEKQIKGSKFPKVAVNDHTQDFVVVWQDDRDGQFDIFARRFTYKCEPVTGDVKVNEDGLKVGHLYPVASFTDKGIAVAWQDNRDGIKKADIYTRYFTPDLSPLTASERVNDDVEAWHYTPAIAASDTGFFTIVWLNFSKSANGDIFAQRYDPDAKKINQNIAISNTTITTEACRIPSVIMGIDNVSFWTSWADSSNSTDKYQIRARYFDKRGSLNTTIKVVNENYANGQRAPDVCRFNDWFSVAWLDSSRTNGRGDIFGQYFVLDPKNEDTLNAQGINYNITKDRAAGRRIWHHPKKDYDNPATSGWNEDPIAEPESLYIPLDSAYVLALAERNIPNQMFFQITDTDTLEYTWRKQGKLNSKEYDMCLLDLGYAEDGSSAGTIEAEQQDTLIKFANDISKCMLVTGNDFGEMYNKDSIFTFFGSKYVGPGNPMATGNIQKINGKAGTFTEGMNFNYPFQQTPDNSVDIIDIAATGSQLIMESEGPGKIIYGRGTSYSSDYKGGKVSTHKNVYLTFPMGSLSNGIYPSTASELTRRILAYQGFNVEPEPIVDLVDSVYTGTVEGTVEFSWTAVSDDNAAEAASKYWLKYTKYNAAVPDLGKMSTEEDFIDTGLTYYQAWAPAAVDVREKKIVYGFAPGDTLIFALKAGDESSPTRWSTLGNEPRIVATGDTVTPHTVRLGYTYGCVNDFCKSERIGIRGGDTLFTTWDASNLYLGYSRCDWRTAGDLFIYFDTRTGGADSTCTYNAGDSCSGFDPAFRPDFCLIIENGTTAVLKKATGSKTWEDSIASYSTSYLSLDSINNYNYLEVRVLFSYLTYTVGNVFKYLVVCNNETSEHSWNAFPTTNLIGKGAKAPVSKYGAYYQFNSLAAGVSPRAVAQPLAIELSEFTCQSGSDGITLIWQTASERNNYEWLIERSISPAEDFQNVATIRAEEGSPIGRSYSYTDTAVLPNTTYYYRLGDKDKNNQITWHGPVTVISGGPVYDKLQLMPCRPNPASGAVNFSYVLPRSGQFSINVYDICGRRVNALEQGQKQSGAYNLIWKGDDSQGRMLPAGVYFYQLNFEGTSLTQRLVLLR
ncbi:T9SS type A sorting domain-containing protein [candidate division TA06 bacterium]|uniref:T9SS type A sorting domain-containing protein n=1 Tax=candidate division TA06 bacterium TaxID=2250710 RepID=A0A933MKH3_UNCT6|nr:T9SS type A sorting domain-containing protein [candidate division TA06 bacterium]